MGSKGAARSATVDPESTTVTGGNEARWAWIPDYNAVFVVGLVGLGAAVYFTLLFGISREFRTTVANNLPFDVPLLGDR